MVITAMPFSFVSWTRSLIERFLGLQIYALFAEIAPESITAESITFAAMRSR
jgi:hypothetical protein